MHDIEAIRRYWEAERELEGRRRPSVPTLTSPPEKTWIWSDLHLSDRDALENFNRRFADIGAMNRHLLAAWRRRVGADDTIICLGDVAHTNIWRDRRLLFDLQTCPGERVLILGNHDITREALKDAGFKTQHHVALYDAHPPLALTHRPPIAVPVGAINIHGHHHNGWEPTDRHINLTVEHWGYEPVAMSVITAQARQRLQRGAEP